VLRSPFFSVSDEGLYHLRGAGRSLFDALVPFSGGMPRPAVAWACEHGGPQHAHANGGVGMPPYNLDAPPRKHAHANGGVGMPPSLENVAPEDRRGMRRAAALLPAWVAAKDRMALAALLEETVFASGYAASAVGRFGGERAYANLRQMVELARRFDQEALYSLGDYIDYVTDFMSSEMRAEQAPVEAPGANAVRLMTIHKAKGLEFAIVALPDLAHAVKTPQGPFFIHPVSGLAIRLRDEDGTSRTSTAMALARSDAAEAERAEAHRLLYVAITRAKDYLIFASHKGVVYTMHNRETWFSVLLEGLGISLQPGEQRARLPGGYEVLVRAQPPAREDAKHGDRRVGPRDLLVGGRVAWARLQERGQQAAGRIVQEAVERIGPLVVTGRPPAQVTATALATYRRCPAAYWWSEVLGVDEPQPPGGAGPGSAGKGRADAGRPKAKGARAEVEQRLSPRQWGRLSHRAMELAVSPDAASVAAAVDGALREAAAAPAQKELRERLAAVVRDFWAGPVGKRVAAARRVHRELPFVLAMGETEIRGVMDLVFENADGQWEVLDYKSAAPAPERAEQAAKEHELQLGLYTLAAGKWLGRPVRQWTVYFLDAARPVEHEVTSESLTAVETAVREALSGIAARRFTHERITEVCKICRFQPLCG